MSGRRALGKGMKEIRAREYATGDRHDVDAFLKAHPHVTLKEQPALMAMELKAPVYLKPEWPAGYLPYEHEEQVDFVNWLISRGIRHFAVPNGGGRSKREAARLKDEGVNSGVPDIVIPYARGSFHHGYCEMKRSEGGEVSKSQRIWIDFLKAQNCCVWVAEGSEEAKKGFLRYWDLGPFDPDAPK